MDEKTFELSVSVLTVNEFDANKWINYACAEGRNEVPHLNSEPY